MGRQWSQAEWDALPQAAKIAIWESHNEAQAATKRTQQWDQWASQNRQYLDNWGESRQRLAEVQKADDEKEWTYEEMQAEIRRNRQEAQQANQHIRGLAAELGQSRNHMQNLTNMQRGVVELSADMASYSRKTGRDARAVLDFANQNGIGDWPNAVSAYEAQTKTDRTVAHPGSWTRAGRDRAASREIETNDAIADLLSRGQGGENEIPTMGSWSRARRKPATAVATEE